MLKRPLPTRTAIDNPTFHPHPLHPHFPHQAHRHSTIHPSPPDRPCPNPHPRLQGNRFGKSPRRYYLRPLHLRARNRMVMMVVKSPRTRAYSVSVRKPDPGDVNLQCTNRGMCDTFP